MDFLDLRKCASPESNNTFQTNNERKRFCSANCCAAEKYWLTKQRNKAQRLINWRERRRAMALGFDGRLGGPRSLSLGTNLKRSREWPESLVWALVAAKTEEL